MVTSLVNSVYVYVPETNQINLDVGFSSLTVLPVKSTTEEANHWPQRSTLVTSSKEEEDQSNTKYFHYFTRQDKTRMVKNRCRRERLLTH